MCRILGQEEIKPHKVRYYLERRDAEFEQKMAEVLCVYREVQVLKKAAKSQKPRQPVAILSYDEKQESRPLQRPRPICRPSPASMRLWRRDHEYKRHGTLSLLAGIDLLTGRVHALVRDRYRSREFIEFLKLLDAAYPASTAIKLILDNHSAHISKQTRSWLATRPSGRFVFTFTPIHGSWLSSRASSPSLPARSCVTSGWHPSRSSGSASWPVSRMSRHPVIHTWSYRLAEAA